MIHPPWSPGRTRPDVRIVEERMALNAAGLAPTVGFPACYRGPPSHSALVTRSTRDRAMVLDTVSLDTVVPYRSSAPPAAGAWSATRIATATSTPSPRPGRRAAAPGAATPGSRGRATGATSYEAIVPFILAGYGCERATWPRRRQRTSAGPAPSPTASGSRASAPWPPTGATATRRPSTGRRRSSTRSRRRSQSGGSPRSRRNNGMRTPSPTRSAIGQAATGAQGFGVAYGARTRDLRSQQSHGSVVVHVRTQYGSGSPPSRRAADIRARIHRSTGAGSARVAAMQMERARQIMYRPCRTGARRAIVPRRSTPAFVRRLCGFPATNRSARLHAKLTARALRRCRRKGW